MFNFSVYSFLEVFWHWFVRANQELMIIIWLGHELSVCVAPLRQRPRAALSLSRVHYRDIATCVISIRYRELLWYTENQSPVRLCWQGLGLQALAARHGTGCLLAKVGQPMGGSQERAARSPACHSLQTAICLPPPVCVCFRENDRHGHDNNTHHALCSHTREGAAFHSRLNYTGLIGFFCPASKTKTLLSLFSALLLQGPSIPSFLSPVLHFSLPFMYRFFLLLLVVRPFGLRTVAWQSLAWLHKLQLYEHTQMLPCDSHRWILAETWFSSSSPAYVCVCALRFGAEKRPLITVSVCTPSAPSHPVLHKGIMVRGALSLTRSRISELFWKVP